MNMLRKRIRENQRKNGVGTINKYHAKKTVVDGIKFDSKIEANYYRQLKLWLRAGQIIKFDRQVEYVLQDGYRLEGRRKQRAIKYKADFVVYYKDGKFDVIDIKGSRQTITPAFRLKKKLFEKKYGKPLVVISAEHGKWVELE